MSKRWAISLLRNRQGYADVYLQGAFSLRMIRALGNVQTKKAAKPLSLSAETIDSMENFNSLDSEFQKLIEFRASLTQLKVLFQVVWFSEDRPTDLALRHPSHAAKSLGATNS